MTQLSFETDVNIISQTTKISNSISDIFTKS